jgi:O-antigen ligase
MLIFLLLAEASMFWTLALEETLPVMRTYIQNMLAVWLVWEFAVTPESCRKLGVAYMLGSYISIANTIREFAMELVGTGKSVQRFTAAGWDQNDLAVSLALGILISRYAAEGGSKRIRILAFCYVPLALVTIALTGSRAGSIVAAVAVLAIAFQWKSKPTLRVAGLGGLLGLTCLGLVLVPQNTLDRILTMGSDVQDMNSRVPIWQAALSEMPSHIVLGAGAGSFRVASGTDMVAHNTFLSVLLEEGLVGLSLFLAIVYLLFKTAWRGDPSTRSIWIAILFCWCVGVSSLTWEQTRLTWIIFALAAAQSQNVGEKAVPALRRHLSRLRPLRAS